MPASPAELEPAAVPGSVDDWLGRREVGPDDARLPVEDQLRHQRHDLGNVWTAVVYLWGCLDTERDARERLDGKVDRLLWAVVGLLGAVIADLITHIAAVRP